MTRFAPEKSAGDILLFVWPEAATMGVSLTAAEHVYRGRSATRLLADLVSIVRMICTDAATPIAAVDIPAIAGVRGLVSGHRSGVAVSLAAMRRFLEAAPGVVEATVAPRALAGNEVRFHASVRTDRPTSRTELLEHYRIIQPWTTGTVIPDELSIVQPSFEAVAECAP